MKKYILLMASAASVGLYAAPAYAQNAQTDAQVADENSPAIIVTGTRRADRTLADSPVPVDVISGDALENSGYTETAKVLSQLVPSFNFPQPAITDGTDALRPATLRGLGPDQTLVLVNGKRRHTSALLNMNGSVGRGSAAVDMNTIPPLAIERIEVLRDGASSQYGSDAIAGVINVQLKKREGNRAQVTYGKYFTDMDGMREATGVVTANGLPVLDPTAGAGDVYQLERGDKVNRKDGATLTLASNFGLPVGDGGYLNITAQYQDRNPTNRSGYDPRRQYQTSEVTKELAANRLNHRYGDAGTNDMNFFVNAGYDVSDNAEVYAFGSYNIRDAESAGFFRRPNDARNRDWSASTTSFVPYYANGFLPIITSTIEDYSLAMGVRGEFGGGWNYDLSGVYGHNSFQFGVEDSFNTSFGEGSQHKFDAGGLRFGQTTLNLDVQREFDLGIGDGVSFAFGGEYRNENFKIVAGEPQSWQGGPFAGAPYFAPAGAQVFPGFRPSNEVDASRHSWAAYAEAETDFSDILTLQLAGRYEHFSDFGGTLNGKAAVRLEPVSGLSLRGSVSTGFRAPSLHQQYYATTSTNNVNGTLVEIGTFPVSDPVAVALGSKPLDPEKALNFGGGITFTMVKGLSITADYYNIKIKDRVVVTENLQDPAINPDTGVAYPRCTGPVTKLLCGAGFNDITSARFFVNGIDTRTQGIEVVASYRVPDFGAGKLTLNAGYNYNTTKITDRAELTTLPGLTLFGRQESLRMTKGQPKDKINVGLDWDYGLFGVTARTNRYGKVLVPGVDAARDQWLGGKWVTDLELRVKPIEAVELALGANNLFDVYPDQVRKGRNGSTVTTDPNYGLNGYFIPYSAFSPFGFNGRFLYGRVSFDF